LVKEEAVQTVLLGALHPSAVLLGREVVEVALNALALMASPLLEGAGA
jgi:hypothetical protein